MMHVHQPPDPLLPSGKITLKPPKPHLFIDLILNLRLLESLSRCTAIIFSDWCGSVDTVCDSAAVWF